METTLGRYLRPTTSDPLRQLHVLRHYGHPLGVDGTKVRVLKQLHQITLSALLKCGKGASLNTIVGGILLHYAPSQPLERQLPDEQLC